MMPQPCEMSSSDYYHWPSGIILKIQCSDLPGSLHREFGAFRRPLENNEVADAALIFCRHPKEMPASGEVLKGHYKGVPWRVVCSDAAGGQASYSFYAPFFGSFLFVRTCLIPVLKKITIQKGGFFLIGSAFMFRGRTFLFSGKPGSGKTRHLLQGVAAGGAFVGDSELIVTSDRKVYPVFPYVEARLRTLYGTVHWSKLDFKKKARLCLYQMLSSMSRNVISFNLLLDSADSQTMLGASSSGSLEHCSWVQIQPGVEDVEPLSAQDLVQSVERYEIGYQQLFGDGIYTPSIRCHGLGQLQKLLPEGTHWKIAPQKLVHDFLHKEMNQDENSEAL